MLFESRFPVPSSKILTPGTFTCRIVQSYLRTGKSGKEYVSWRLRNLSNGKFFFYGTPIQGQYVGMFHNFIHCCGDKNHQNGEYDTHNVIDRLVEVDLEVEKDFYKARKVSEFIRDPIKIDIDSLNETFGSILDRIPSEELSKAKRTELIDPKWIDYLLHLASKEFVFTSDYINDHCSNILLEYNRHASTFFGEYIDIVCLAKILLKECDFTLHFEDDDASKFKDQTSCTVHEKISAFTKFSKKEVWINRVGIHEKTWRFSLAHEIFHVLMHTGFYEIHSSFVKHLHCGIREFESNASIFARGILLPTDSFCKSFKNFCDQFKVDPLNDDETRLKYSIRPVIREISDLLIAPDGAVKWRAKFLNLLGDQKRAERILYDDRYSY